MRIFAQLRLSEPTARNQRTLDVCDEGTHPWLPQAKMRLPIAKLTRIKTTRQDSG